MARNSRLELVLTADERQQLDDLHADAMAANPGAPTSRATVIRQLIVAAHTQRTRNAAPAKENEPPKHYARRGADTILCTNAPLTAFTAAEITSKQSHTTCPRCMELLGLATPKETQEG